jgi:hypothetical protein
MFVKINPNGKQLVVYRVTTLLFPGKQIVVYIAEQVLDKSKAPSSISRI